MEKHKKGGGLIFLTLGLINLFGGFYFFYKSYLFTVNFTLVKFTEYSSDALVGDIFLMLLFTIGYWIIAAVISFIGLLFVKHGYRSLHLNINSE